MTTRAVPFQPVGGVQALLDYIYRSKFSKNIPLIMVLLFAVFAIWRTNHFVSARMGVTGVVSMALAVCIEIAMLASGASCFIAMREAYIRELQEKDADRAKWGVRLSWVMLAATTTTLLVLAGADGALESKGDLVFILLMLLVQFVQSCTVLSFLNKADLEERDALRHQYENLQRTVVQQSANECPYCHKEVAINNRKRHIEACPMRPQGE